MTSRNEISKPSLALRRLLFAAAFAAAFGVGERADARDGVWTIRCAEFSGPNGLEVARQLAETLKRTPGIREKDVFVMEASDKIIRLYYGRYRRRTDPKTRKRSMPRKLRQDMDLMRELVDETGHRYFLMSVLVRVPVPDAGNPDWALRNVDGVYTLQVAVFGVVVGAKDDALVAFYTDRGFTRLPSARHTLFLPLSDAIKRLATST